VHHIPRSGRFLLSLPTTNLYLHLYLHLYLVPNRTSRPSSYSFVSLPLTLSHWDIIRCQFFFFIFSSVAQTDSHPSLVNGSSTRTSSLGARHSRAPSKSLTQRAHLETHT